MEDGLYQVTTKYLCAGFVIEHGDVTDCAPILRKRIEYWKTVAVRIPEHVRPEMIEGVVTKKEVSDHKD